MKHSSLQLTEARIPVQVVYSRECRQEEAGSGWPGRKREEAEQVLSFPQTPSLSLVL